MNRWKAGSLALFLGAALTVAGCSGKNSQAAHEHMADLSMDPIKVELSLEPAAAKVNETVRLQALVTQKEEPVDDAKEVTFEITGPDGTADSIEVEGERQEGGTYTAEYTFDAAGEYKVTSHVTARAQHSMPSQKIKVEP
ncbi:FixH family protein [Paenibacillus sp. CN-4]|uniref:FixH family protein n=1 Tax=Paenibacillus nanchangensis TaxID=3348343 RepID=UPI00397D9811